MHSIFINAVGKIGSYGSGCGLFRVGSAHYFSVFKNCIVTFEYLHNDRARDHKSNQILEKAALFVFSIKSFSLRLCQVQHFGSNNFQAVFFKTAIDFTDNIFCYSIRFDD